MAGGDSDEICLKQYDGVWDILLAGHWERYAFFCLLPWSLRVLVLWIVAGMPGMGVGLTDWLGGIF